MNKIRDKSAVPPKPWKYIDPDDSQFFQSVYYKQLYEMAKTYRRANNYPIGTNFQEQFDAILCQHSAELCFDYIEPSLASKVGKLAVALSNWAKSGFRVRSAEEADAILNICRACPHYAGETGILRVACRVCGCSRKKAYLATEHCPDTPPRW